MARLLTQSWETTTNSYEPASPTGVLPGIAVSSEQARSGAYSLKASGATTGSLTSQVPIGAGTQGFFVRTWLYISADPSSAPTSDSANMLGIELWVKPGRLLQFGPNATPYYTSDAIPLGTWTCFEFSIAAGTQGASRTFTIRRDGTQVHSSSQTITVINQWRWSRAASSDGVWYWDDAALNDSAGTAETSWCGHTAYVNYLWPGAVAGTMTTVTQVGTAATNGSRVSERPPDGDTTYWNLTGTTSVGEVPIVSPSAVGGGTAIETEPFVTASDTIKLIEVHATVRLASASSGNYGTGIRLNNTVADGTLTTWALSAWITNGSDDPNTTPRTSKSVTYVRPSGGGALTVADFDGTSDALSIRVKTTDGNPDTYCTNLFAIVEFVPATPAGVAKPALFASSFRRRRL